MRGEIQSDATELSRRDTCKDEAMQINDTKEHLAEFCGMNNSSKETPVLIYTWNKKPNGFQEKSHYNAHSGHLV